MLMCTAYLWSHIFRRTRNERLPGSLDGFGSCWRGRGRPAGREKSPAEARTTGSCRWKNRCGRNLGWRRSWKSGCRRSRFLEMQSRRGKKTWDSIGTTSDLVKGSHFLKLFVQQHTFPYDSIIFWQMTPRMRTGVIDRKKLDICLKNLGWNLIIDETEKRKTEKKNHFDVTQLDNHHTSF